MDVAKLVQTQTTKEKSIGWRCTDASYGSGLSFELWHHEVSGDLALWLEGLAAGQEALAWDGAQNDDFFHGTSRGGGMWIPLGPAEAFGAVDFVAYREAFAFTSNASGQGWSADTWWTWSEAGPWPIQVVAAGGYDHFFQLVSVVDSPAGTSVSPMSGTIGGEDFSLEYGFEKFGKGTTAYHPSTPFPSPCRMP